MNVENKHEKTEQNNIEGKMSEKGIPSKLLDIVIIGLCVAIICELSVFAIEKGTTHISKEIYELNTKLDKIIQLNERGK